MHSGVFCVFLLAAFLQPISSARILAIMPYYGASHFFVFEKFLEELARRGHSMDVVSYVSRKTPVPNYRDIPLSALLNDSSSTVGFLNFQTDNIEFEIILHEIGHGSALGEMFKSAIFFYLFCLLDYSSSAKILTLTPYYGASHFFVYQPLLEALAKRGHSIDVVSYFPRSSPLANYTDISVNSSRSTVGFKKFDGLLSTNVATNLIGLWKLAQEYDKVHSLPQVVALANGTYDLVLIEMFNTNLFYGIAYKTGAPIIGLSSCTMLPWSSDSMAVPSQTSYVPNNLGGKSYQMNFFQRVMNTIEFWIARVVHKLLIDRNAQAVAEHYLGPLPPLSDIASNTSLILIHTHFSYLGHSPLPPSVVEVGGLNLKPLKPLAPDVEKLLNDSNGAIYFSMGSVLVGNSMSEKKKQMFVNVLAASGKTVLWKQEETIKNKPNNIITKPWFSQRDILQHPKVELFISHCGNLGLTEGVDAGVPIICIPMYGDQHRNARAAEDYGISIFLDYRSLTEDILRSAVNEILTNKRFKETSKKVQAAFRDRPLSPMDTAIYWVEYVLKHGPITRAPYSHMPIWLREGIDVAAFLFFILVSSAYIVIKIFTTYFNSKMSIKKEKQS